MAKGVLELACELARQVLRHELSTNPNALQPVVREALAVLAVDSKAALVRMHPLDMEVLSEVLRQEFSTFALTLLPDASVARGGCLVESAGTVVDGTVEKRWMRAVASLGFDSPWEPINDDAS
jgi:flagellar assembly protein FliH